MSINTHLGKNIDGGWIIYRDSDNTFEAVLTNEADSSALDTTDIVFSMEFYSPTLRDLKLTLTEADADIINDGSGTIEFNLTQEDIAVSLQSDRYFFVIKYSINGGDQKPLAQGWTTITKGTNPGTTTTSVNFPVNIAGVTINKAVSLINTFIEVSETFAAISASTRRRIVQVNADETNANEKTFYIHDGSRLHWIITQEI